MGTLKNSRRLVTLGGLAIAGLLFATLPEASAQTAVYSGTSAIKSSPIAYNGWVYFGDSAGVMRGVPLGAGTAWSFNCKTDTNGGNRSTILGRPALFLVAGTLYLVFPDSLGALYCLNATTGAKVWSISKPTGGLKGCTSMPSVIAGADLASTKIYYSGSKRNQGYVFRVDGNGLNPITSAPLGTGVSSAAVAPGNGVFVGVTGGGAAAYKLSEDLQTILLQFGTGKNSLEPPYIYMNYGAIQPAVLVAASDGTISASEISNATVVYQNVTVAAGVALTFPVVYNNVIYLGAANGNIYSASAVDGSGAAVFYNGAAGSAITGLAMDLAGPALHFGNAAGNFYKVPITGTPSVYTTPGANSAYATTPSITGTVVLAGNDNGNLYSFPR